MTYFTGDNTEGFTAAQLDAMNKVYHHNLQIAFCDLPDGAEGASDDLIAQIQQSVGERILARIHADLTDV